MGSVWREAPRQMTDPSSSGRKLAARKINERVKLGASFLNTLSVAVLGAAIIVPAFNETIHLPPLARWASGRNGLTFSGPMALSTTGAGIHERGFADGGAGGATPSRGAGLRARITGTCRRSR